MATDLSQANEMMKHIVTETVLPHLLGDEMYEPNEFMRKGHPVWIDHDPRWLIDRERFRRQYEGMQREGLERGYLDDDMCTVTTEVGYNDIEWDETWEEYGKRVAEITGKLELKYRDELLRDT